MQQLVPLLCSSEIKMATQPVKGVVRQVKPLISTDSAEARKRVIRLYKAWYRQILPIISIYNLPVTATEAREKLKGEFMKHKNLTDLRAIDMLVIKGELELKETLKKWKQRCQVMYFFKDTQITPPNTFLGRFLSGVD